MTTPPVRQRLRDADPGRDVPLPFTADDLLTAFAAGTAERPQTPRAAFAPLRRRRRWATVGVAAALLLSTPLWWPGSPPPSSTALAVTQDGDAVRVVVPRDGLDAARLQAALDEAGVRATVLAASTDCPTPFPEGLREGYDVAPPEQNFAGPDDPAAFHFTFYPDRMPKGSQILFAVEPEATMLLLVDQVPACLPPVMRTGPTG